jgi:hypothetical protein
VARKDEAKAEEDLAKNHIRAFIGEHAGLITPYGKIHYKRNATSRKVDWEGLARSKSPTADEIARFTSEKEGARPLMPKLKDIT